MHAFTSTCKFAHSLGCICFADWLQQNWPATALQHAAGSQEGLGGSEELFLELMSRPGVLESQSGDTPLLYLASRAGFSTACARLLELGMVSRVYCWERYCKVGSFMVDKLVSIYKLKC